MNPRREYDTDRYWLYTMAAGALVAEQLGISRKAARVLLRQWKDAKQVEQDADGMFSRLSLMAHINKHRATTKNND